MAKSNVYSKYISTNNTNALWEYMTLHKQPNEFHWFNNFVRWFNIVKCNFRLRTKRVMPYWFYNQYVIFFYYYMYVNTFSNRSALNISVGEFLDQNSYLVSCLTNMFLILTVFLDSWCSVKGKYIELLLKKC